jgi:tagaturonate reductase
MKKKNREEIMKINEIYPKKVYKEKIIQFGEGGFLRGFVDWIVQLTNEATDFNGGVVVVQPIEKGLCHLLDKQDCTYTHVMRGIKDKVATVDKKVIDCITRTVKPYDDFDMYLSLAENPDFRFIVSNTTESGIVYNSEDKESDAPYISFPGKLTLLLKKRFDLNLPGFIFLPCELIDKNGATLRKCVLDYSKLWGFGEDFENWIVSENTFCNTLVDRIVTGYPKDEDLGLEYEDNMLNTSEIFHLWVIEGPAEKVNEFPFAQAKLNIIVTDNLEGYRTRKVRILNGAHTSMIPYALLSGLETVGDCMNDEKMSAFVKSCVYDEIIPTLDLPEAELIDYADNVFERFCNPYIRHLCASISLNSVSKFKVRVLPSLLEYIQRKGEMPEKLLFSFAKLIEFYKKGTPNDDEKVMEFMKKASVGEILSNKAFWDLDLSYLAKEVEKYVNK